jgi:NADPH:quinone reductase-like Zn-dependent oxidoreductase
MKENTMKAAVFEKQGSAFFIIKEIPIPSAESGQLLIKVESAGANFSGAKSSTFQNQRQRQRSHCGD